MAYSNPKHLISTDSLETLLPSDNLRLFDVTVHLVPNPPGYKAVSGREDYDKTHIPGAAFLDLVQDLSDTSSGFGFTLPAKDQLQAAFRKAGVNDGDQVVFYSSAHMMWATRAWWLLHSSGHQNVAVLDGGLPKWLAEEKKSESNQSTYAAGDFNVAFDQSKWADKEQVLNSVSDSDVCTINALSPGVYSGDADMHYGRRGHIENSKNIYYDNILDNGCFRSAEELKSLFEEKDVLGQSQIITYCGGGISATIDTLALTLIGQDNVAVYDGSMSEWVKDESLPLIVGD